MKKTFSYFILSISLLFATCQIQYDSEADRVLHLNGNTLRGNFSSLRDCESYRSSRPYFERSHSRCVGCSSNNQDYTQPPNSSTYYDPNMDSGIYYNIQGNNYFSARKYRKAIENYKKALKYLPYDKVIQQNLKRAQGYQLTELGVKEYKARNWERAIYYYKKALQYTHHKVIQQNLKNAQNALEGHRLNDLGVKEYKARNWERAIYYYKKAGEYLPYNKVFQQNLKNANIALANERKEVATEGKGLNLKSKGDEAFSRGDYKQAIYYYKKAQEYLPFDIAINQNLKNAQNALIDQRKDAERKSTGLMLNKKGNKALERGDYKQAISYYEEALAQIPNDTDIQQNLKKAQNALARDREIDKKKKEISRLYDLGILAEKDKNWEDAIYYYKKLLQYYPNDKNIKQILINAENELSDKKKREKMIGSLNDPELAPGYPLDQEFTEHKQIRKYVEEAKYANMNLKELNSLKGNYSQNKEIQKSINSLIAKKEAMSKLEDLVHQYNEQAGIKEFNEADAKREVQRAVGQISEIFGISDADSLEAWWNNEISTGEVVIKSGKHIVTDKMIELVYIMCPELGMMFMGPALGEKIAVMGINLAKLYFSFDKAGDHYVKALEIKAYMESSNANGDNLDRWFEMREKAHEESSRLHKLIKNAD